MTGFNMRSFHHYREELGLTAIEAFVGMRFDLAACRATGEEALGVALRPEHQAAFTAAVDADRGRQLAADERQATAAKAAASTSSNADLADALERALGPTDLGWGATLDARALASEAARRLRSR